MRLGFRVHVRDSYVRFVWPTLGPLGHSKESLKVLVRMRNSVNQDLRGYKPTPLTLNHINTPAMALFLDGAHEEGATNT